jgi:hypothetical protein
MSKSKAPSELLARKINRPMKKRPVFFFLFLLAILFVANSGGPGAATGRDRTGSPLASGDCSNCHIGGDYGAEISARLLSDTTEVQEYIPGQTYTFQVKISTTSPAERYGFQAVALLGGSNENAGMFDNLPSGTQITTLNGRDYFEHANKLQVDSFEVEWTAPEAGSGTVQFYAAGNAVNNASGSGGDDPDVLDLPLTITEGIASSVSSVWSLKLDWQIFPNPAKEEIWIQINEPVRSDLQARLLDARGIILQQETINSFSSQNFFSVKELPAGMYYLQLSDAKAVVTKRFLKLD